MLSNCIRYFFVFCFVLVSCTFHSQNQYKKWYFGNLAGLDFMTNPPTALSGSMTTSEGCASISDAAGNLLFYTDGTKIWDQTHAVMATGMTGNSSSTQSSIIVKKPGSSNIYYVFSLGASGTGTLCYSVVDMTMNGGLGGVTSLNTVLATNNTEKLTSVAHCNGTDFWVISCPTNSTILKAYLVSAAGVNTVPVVSQLPNVSIDWIGNMKTSPNGRRIAFANYFADTFGLCDFDNSTGVASNEFNLSGVFTLAYGVEFSPDGTKLFGGVQGNKLYEWNLCAGSSAAISASMYSVTTTNSPMGMQLGTDGKIYVAHGGTQYLGIIANPNGWGAACNYTDNGISLAPRSAIFNLPNFITSGFSQNNMPFTYTISNVYGCNTASFTAPSAQGYTLGNCTASSYAGVVWDFGDPASGAANTSTLPTLSHSFSAIGTYTTKLIMFNNCGGGSDTIQQVLTINQLCISVVGQSITCANLGSASVSVLNGTGPFTFTWLPSGQTASVATGLNPGTHTLIAYDVGSGATYSSTTTFVPLVPFSGLLSNSQQQPCNGVNTGTASIVLSGGSGNQNYLWTGPNGTQTTALASGLGAGTYTVNVTDALTSCAVTQTFNLGPPPPPLGVFITASSASACVGNPISFTATGYGGSPGPPPFFTYSWSPGPSGNVFSTTQALAGNYSYSVTVKDALNCTVVATVPASIIATPPLVVSDVSICPMQTATLVATGANSYTWSNGQTVGTITDSPLITTSYTLTGSAQGCTATATPSIILKAVPVPTVTTNGPICSGKTLNLFGTGGSTYSWTGPFGFSSGIQNPQINVSTTNNSGVYNLTVTAANSCTAAASTGFTIYATPLLTVSGSTICTTQTLNLLANSAAAVSFTWVGPASFTSVIQNPAISNPPVTASGVYSAMVTSAQGCTNAASATISVVDVPFVAFSSNSPKCQGQILTFNSSASSGGLLYTWNGPNGFSSTLQNPAIVNANPLASGIYTLSLTTGPCAASATNEVIVYPTPVPLIVTNGLVCETKSLNLSVSNTYPVYFWSGPLSYTNNTQGIIINNAQVYHSGQYQVVVTDTNNCQGSSSASVTIESNPILSATGATVCFGDPAVIVASGAASYVWTGPGGLTATTQQATINAANNTTPFIYYVTGTGVNTCTSVASAQVSTRVLPVAIASVKSKACVNSEVYFNGTGGVSYNWSGPLNFAGTEQNFSVTAVNEGMSGNYTLMVTDEWGCRGFTSKALVITPPPQGSLWSSSQQNCVPFCSDFKLLSSGPPLVESVWQLSGQSFTSEVFNYCFATAGTYTLRGDFVNQENCRSTVMFVINAYPLPQADYSYFPQLPVENEEIQFKNISKSSDLKSWSWYFAQNTAYPENSPAVSYVFKDAGTYPVALVIKNKWGCADTVVKAIVVDEDFYVFVPNAFTPNEDNLNETFTAVGRGVKAYTLQVYDRWGEKLFETGSMAAGWDGNFKGKACKEDVYVWKLSSTSTRGKEKKMTGSVLLYR